MLNQNNFSCGVYHVKGSGNAEALAGKIKENILARQWLCGFPEKLVILTVGDYIASVFGSGELTDTFVTKLSAEYSSKKQLLSVLIPAARSARVFRCYRPYEEYRSPSCEPVLLRLVRAEISHFHACVHIANMRTFLSETSML